MRDFAIETGLSDRDLEHALVALVFADNDNIDHLGKLTPEDFIDPVMGAALAGAIDMRAEGRPINLVTLKARLEGVKLDDDRTGLDVLRSLSLGGTLPPVIDIAARLRSLAVKRRLAEYLRGLADAATDESQPMSALAADGIRQLNDYLADAVTAEKTSFDLYTASHEFIDWLQSDGDPVEIPTGLKDLDRVTGGWHRGEFAILAGRPSMGKSAIALSSMLRTALKGHGVLFFSLEMTKRQVTARALSDLSYTNPAIAYSDLKPKRADPHIDRLLNAAERFKEMPLEVETKSGLTVADIFARTRRAVEEFNKRGTPLALVVVDHLLKIRPSNRYAGQPVKEIDETSEAMCVLAKSLNVAVLGLHQLNRQVEGRDNQRPLMSDLRQSGSLEQDADVVLFAYRPAYQFERQRQEGVDDAKEAEIKLELVQNDLEIQIAKQRNGPTMTLEFWVSMPSNVVRDKEWRSGR